MARKYQKKNQEYWDSLGKKEESPTFQSQNKVQQIDFKPALVGDPLFSASDESTASCNSRLSGGERGSTRSNRITTKTAKDRFANISEGLLPFDYSRDSVDAHDAVVLCQKAYFNIAVFKSTIDLLAEFANSDIFLEGGNASSKKFITAWMKKIRFFDLKEQFFREYYRSGNVFLYELTGRLTTKSIKGFDLTAKSLDQRIPVKFILLNPADITVKGQLNFGTFSYAKALTPFEIARLKDAKTEEERAIFESLPDDIKKQLDKKGGVASNNDAIYLTLDPNLVHPIFYKKQDYEPMSVPMGFSVLDDLNKKIELKKVDQAIARSIENVILLVTMGAEPDKGGINNVNLKAMEEIFQNKSVGRVLVSDYTTKADFILPDLRKVIGKEKYEVLNKDIEQGLANILLGESKYSDTEFKLKIFFRRLEEARDRFLNDFLNKQIESICKGAGYRDIPIAKFSKSDAITSESLQKLITRMMELGVITPEQGMDVIHKGEFPTSEEMQVAQKKALSDKKEGFYVPLVSSQLLLPQDEEAGSPAAPKSGSKRDPKKSPSTSGPSGGRPVGTASKYSNDNLFSITGLVRELESKAFDLYKKKIGKKTLDAAKKKVVREVCCSVVVDSEIEEWDAKLEAIVSNPTSLAQMGVNPNVLAIGAEHGLSDYPAALLYHSTKLQNAEN